MDEGKLLPGLEKKTFEQRRERRLMPRQPPLLLGGNASSN